MSIIKKHISMVSLINETDLWSKTNYYAVKVYYRNILTWPLYHNFNVRVREYGPFETQNEAEALVYRIKINGLI